MRALCRFGSGQQAKMFWRLIEELFLMCKFKIILSLNLCAHLSQQSQPCLINNDLAGCNYWVFLRTGSSTVLPALTQTPCMNSLLKISSFSRKAVIKKFEWKLKLLSALYHRPQSRALIQSRWRAIWSQQQAPAVLHSTGCNLKLGISDAFYYSGFSVVVNKPVSVLQAFKSQICLDLAPNHQYDGRLTGHRVENWDIKVFWLIKAFYSSYEYICIYIFDDFLCIIKSSWQRKTNQEVKNQSRDVWNVSYSWLKSVSTHIFQSIFWSFFHARSLSDQLMLYSMWSGSPCANWF